MRKPIALSVTLLAAFAGANCAQPAHSAEDTAPQGAAHYLQASSSVTQCPGTAPEVVAMDITDAASGVAMAANQMTVSEAGAYVIVAAPQVGREGGGPYGCFDLWLRVNGADVVRGGERLTRGRAILPIKLAQYAASTKRFGSPAAKISVPMVLAALSRAAYRSSPFLPTLTDKTMSGPRHHSSPASPSGSNATSGTPRQLGSASNTFLAHSMDSAFAGAAP